MNHSTKRAKAKKVLVLSGLILVFAQIFAGENLAQKRKAAPKSVKKQGVTKKAKTNSAAAQNLNLPKVTQIDEIALKDLLKRGDANSKPLLVNFWATWCDPCREEFPELVKINHEYAGKIDFVTVSLDDLAEIKRDVPKFLAEMKATMPAFLLKTENEEAAIATISKDYAGGLPFTILFDGKGASVYFIQGKVKPDILRTEIDKIILNNSNQTLNQQVYNLTKEEQEKYFYEKGRAEASTDVTNGKYLIKMYGLVPGSSPELRAKLKKKYDIEIIYYGCIVSNGDEEYGRGYNEVSTVEMKRKFGHKVLAALGF